MEAELAGVVRYTHYSLMVFGYNRIPIVSWMESNANEGLLHARKAGELVTLMGGTLRLGLASSSKQNSMTLVISCAKVWRMSKIH